VPDPAFHGHFNLLRAYLEPAGVAGVKVVGDYADNYRLGLPSFSPSTRALSSSSETPAPPAPSWLARTTIARAPTPV
jgi:ornithine cyclodeaminase/alanine dehydrogenase-like protein (mu-crystallin family)